MKIFNQNKSFKSLILMISIIAFSAFNCSKSEDDGLFGLLLLSQSLTSNSNTTTTITVIPGENGVIYVHPNGSDTALGTMAEPVLTIGQAVTLAEANDLQRINVAAGTYAGATIARHVSLYGGYSASDWATRDYTTNPTIISSALTVQLSSASTNDLAREIVLDGFNFDGTVSMDVYELNSTFTVSNNIIRNGLTFPSLTSLHFVLQVDNNTFTPAGYDIANPAITTSTTAISVTPAAYDITVSNNFILGYETGVSLLNSLTSISNAVISNNTIYSTTAIAAEPQSLTINNNSITKGLVQFDDYGSNSYNLTMDSNTIHDGQIYVNGAIISSSSSFTNNSVTNMQGGYALYVRRTTTANGYFRPVQSGNSYTTMGTVDDLGIVKVIYNMGFLTLENSTVEDLTDGTGTRYGIDSPTSNTTVINNNVIKVMTGTPLKSYGVVVTSLNINMTGNTIMIGNTTIASYGVYAGYGFAVFNNNIVIIGSSSLTYGIYDSYTLANSTSLSFNNNTIHGGSGTTSAMAYYGGLNRDFNNNILSATGGDCLFSTNSGALSVNIKNNNFSGCINFLNFSGTVFTDIATLEAGGNASGRLASASGNTAVTPVFTAPGSGDYSLTATNDCNLLQGGLDLSASFTTDAAGVSRTATTTCGPTNANAAGWSMGAYERD